MYLYLSLWKWLLEVNLGPAIDATEDEPPIHHEPWTVIEGDGCEGCDECPACCPDFLADQGDA